MKISDADIEVHLVLVEDVRSVSFADNNIPAVAKSLDKFFINVSSKRLFWAAVHQTIFDKIFIPPNPILLYVGGLYL
jgi:hypothetical protein